jgi:hypothetical protein
MVGYFICGLSGVSDVLKAIIGYPSGRTAAEIRGS